MGNYLGEIGGSTEESRGWILDMQIGQSRYATGGFMRYRITDFISVTGKLTYNLIQGADSISENINRASRNLSFKNDIFHASLRGEYAILSLYDLGGNVRFPLDMKVYGHLGYGMVFHNPKAYHQGEWVALRPLRTEGQSKEYSKFALSFPMGAGLFYTFNRVHRFGWEFSWAWTATDYLDDISTVYPDPADLPNETSVALSNRYVNRGIEAEQYGPGSPRGGSGAKDHLMSNTFYYSMVFKGNYKTSFNPNRSRSRRRGYSRRGRRSRAKF